MEKPKKTGPIIGDGNSSRFALWREPDLVDCVNKRLIAAGNDASLGVNYSQSIANIHMLSDSEIGLIGAVFSVDVEQ